MFIPEGALNLALLDFTNEVRTAERLARAGDTAALAQFMSPPLVLGWIARLTDAHNTVHALAAGEDDPVTVIDELRQDIEDLEHRALSAEELVEDARYDGDMEVRSLERELAARDEEIDTLRDLLRRAALVNTTKLGE